MSKALNTIKKTLKKNNNNLWDVIVNELWYDLIINPLLGLRFKLYYKLGLLKSEKKLDLFIKGRLVTFNETFDTNSLDKNIWDTHFPWGRNYQDFLWWDDNCINVKEGILKLKSEYYPLYRKDYTGERIYPWVSGMIHSAKSFNQTHGRWVAKMKLPNVKGAFPAFWLLHKEYTPKGVNFKKDIIPEVDIMEYFWSGKKNLKFQTNLHFGHSKTKYRDFDCGHGINNVDLSKRYHTYEVEWTKRGYYFYVDGLLVTIRKYKQALSDIPCYIILNNSVKKDVYDSGEMTHEEFDVAVDWVRVYK